MKYFSTTKRNKVLRLAACLMNLQKCWAEVRHKGTLFHFICIKFSTKWWKSEQCLWRGRTGMAHSWCGGIFSVLFRCEIHGCVCLVTRPTVSLMISAFHLETTLQLKNKKKRWRKTNSKNAKSIIYSHWMVPVFFCLCFQSPYVFQQSLGKGTNTVFIEFNS